MRRDIENIGAKGETRTLTPKALEPKSSASANSATFAEALHPSDFCQALQVVAKKFSARGQ